MSPSAPAPAPKPAWPTPERLEYLFRHVAHDPGAQKLKALLLSVSRPAQP